MLLWFTSPTPNLYDVTYMNSPHHKYFFRIGFVLNTTFIREILFQYCIFCCFFYNNLSRWRWRWHLMIFDEMSDQFTSCRKLQHNQKLYLNWITGSCFEARSGRWGPRAGVRWPPWWKMVGGAGGWHGHCSGAGRLVCWKVVTHAPGNKYIVVRKTLLVWSFVKKKDDKAHIFLCNI